MITPLYPTFQKRINDSFDALERNQIAPWAMFNSGKPMRVTSHSNKPICYEGGGFEGSPEHVFWTKYIEPFMEEIVAREIFDAAVMASERKVNGDVLLGEVQDLLLAKIQKTFMKMADIDQRLKGSGYPKDTPLRSIESEYENMKNFVELRIKAERELWRRSRLDIWLKNNKFSVWAIGSLLALAAAGAALYEVLN